MVVIIMSTEPEELLPEHHPCGVLLQLLTLTLSADTRHHLSTRPRPENFPDWSDLCEEQGG